MKFSKRFLRFHNKHRCDLYADKPEWMMIHVRAYWFDAQDIHA